MMALGMSPSFRLAQALECPICLRNRDDEQALEDETMVALFGCVDPYAQCPNCRQIVNDPALLHDAEYRRKVRVKIYEDTGRVLKERSL